MVKVVRRKIFSNIYIFAKKKKKNFFFFELEFELDFLFI